jgi:micrococcal nuclease
LVAGTATSGVDYTYTGGTATITAGSTGATVFTNPLKLSAQTAHLFKVTHVYDGDTIQISTGQKIRYIGIDTPELQLNNAEQCYAQEAFQKNRELVNGKYIRLEKDISQTDKYGRLLRYIYLIDPITMEEQSVGDLLVQDGYARVLTIPPDVKYTQRLLLLQQEAQVNNRGLWKKCNYK